MREFFQTRHLVNEVELEIKEIIEGPLYALKEGLIHATPQEGLVQEALMPLLVDASQASRQAATEFVRSCTTK